MFIAFLVVVVVVVVIVVVVVLCVCAYEAQDNIGYSSNLIRPRRRRGANGRSTFGLRSGRIGRTISVTESKGGKSDNKNFIFFLPVFLDPRSCPQNGSIRHDEARTENNCPSLSKGNYSVFFVPLLFWTQY